MRFFCYGRSQWYARPIIVVSYYHYYRMYQTRLNGGTFAQSMRFLWGVLSKGGLPLVFIPPFDTNFLLLIMRTKKLYRVIYTLNLPSGSYRDSYFVFAYSEASAENRLIEFLDKFHPNQPFDIMTFHVPNFIK